MSKPSAQHPWAKYYSERGAVRPPLADLAVRPAGKPRTRRAAPPKPKAAEMSADLAAAVAAVTSHVAAPGSTAMPFITALQKEAVAVELKRRSRVRIAQRVLIAFALVFALHLTVTRIVYRAPSAAALLAHVESLPEDILPFYSSSRQPLQADGVTITQADQIDANHFRYVASVTLRLRKPLFVPASTNGTMQYRRLQEALFNAREQELRFKLFSQSEAPEVPSLPLLLQRTHQAGESIIVRVPFTARRFGWQWRLAAPQSGIRTASRNLEGDSLELYEDTPHLIYGVPATLADIRQRTKLANVYVQEVTKAILRQSNVQAVADANADKPAQTEVAESTDQGEPEMKKDPPTDRPAFDPDAPAVVLPVAGKVAANPSRGTLR